MNSLKGRRSRIALSYNLGVLAIAVLSIAMGALLESGAFTAFWVTLLVLHLLTFRRFSLVPLLERRLLHDHGCPACGCVIPLNNWWRCSCGFTGYQPRHALAPCFNCGKVFSWLTCAECEAQIPV